MAESFADLPKHLQEAIGRLSLLGVEDVHALAEFFSSLESVGRWGRTPAKYLEFNYLLAPQVEDSRLRVGLVRAAELGARLHFWFDRWRELAIQTRLGFEHSPLESAHLIWCESLADLAEGFLPEAIEKASESLKVATEFEDLGLIGDSSFVLGSCLVENGKLGEARAQFEAGVGVAELLDVHSALLQKLAMLDYVEGREGSNPQRRAREALDLARRAADRYQEARALSTEAAISMGCGDFARAKRKFKAAVDVHIERLGALAELAVHQVWREEFSEAERTLIKAWRVGLHVNESIWLATIARYRALVSSRLPSASESPEHWTKIAKEHCEDETRRPSSWVPHDPTRIAVWPDEVITYDAARMRVYTSIKRLRKLGLKDWIETVDEGYRLRDELDIELDEGQD